MMRVIIDGRRIHCREHLYNEIGQVLELPDYFGYNLDDLYDILTEQDADLEVEFINRRELKASLGGCYIEQLTRMLKDAGATVIMS